MLYQLLLVVALLQIQKLDCWETKLRHQRKHINDDFYHDEESEATGGHRSQTDTRKLVRGHRQDRGGHHKQQLEDNRVRTKEDENKNMSIFRSANNTIVMAHAGSRTSLPCQIFKDSQHGVITWGLLPEGDRPYTLLTVGDSLYTDNLRFSIEKPIRHDHWNLLINPVTLADSGEYECQATIHPPQSIIVKLVVQEAYAEIIGTKEKVFKSESKLQLVCALKQATSKPEFIFWYHNDRMINYDHNEGISVAEDMSGSTLTISSVSVRQSGNYTCQPSNMKSDSVIVTILAENKSPNALQDKASGNTVVIPQVAAGGHSILPGYSLVLLVVAYLLPLAVRPSST